MKLPCRCKLIKSVYIPAPDCREGASVVMAEVLDVQTYVWYGQKHFGMKIGTRTDLSKPDEKAMKTLAQPDTNIVLIVSHHLMRKNVYYYGEQIFELTMKPMYAEPTPPDGYVVMRSFPRRGNKSMPFSTRKALMTYIQQAFNTQPV